MLMETKEILTRLAHGRTLVPCDDLCAFAEALVNATGIPMNGWTFYGHPNTQEREENRFSASSRLNGGIGISLDLKTGQFEVDHKGLFKTNATGLVQWIKSPIGDPPTVEERPSYLPPHKRGGVSRLARQAISDLGGVK